MFSFFVYLYSFWAVLFYWPTKVYVEKNLSSLKRTEAKFLFPWSESVCSLLISLHCEALCKCLFAARLKPKFFSGFKFFRNTFSLSLFDDRGNPAKNVLPRLDARAHKNTAMNHTCMQEVFISLSITAQTCRHMICSYSFSDVVRVVIQTTSAVTNKLPHISIPGANGLYGLTSYPYFYNNPSSKWGRNRLEPVWCLNKDQLYFDFSQSPAAACKLRKTSSDGAQMKTMFQCFKVHIETL